MKATIKLAALVILLMSLTSVKGAEKIIKVFSDDTLYTVDSRNITLYNRQVFLSRDFKDKLPEGTYVLYTVKRKDSYKRNLDRFIYAIGQFNKDSLREGTFRYNRTYVGKWKEKKYFYYYTCNFHNGILDGVFTLKYSNGITHLSGSYKNGLLDGVVINGVLYAETTTFMVYKQGVLFEWYIHNREKVYISGVGIESFRKANGSSF